VRLSIPRGLKAASPVEPLDRARQILAETDVLTGERESDRFAAARLIYNTLVDDGVDNELALSVVDTAVDDLIGFGPLELLIRDADVTEIMVNGPEEVWVEKGGCLSKSEICFRDAEHVRVVLDRLLRATGRRIDEGVPLVDARLWDGSRLNAVLAPVAVGGPLITIRRAAARRLAVADLVRGRSISREMAAFLHACVEGRANILVSGGAGTGKTTLLAALAALVPGEQRIVTIEDVCELRIDHPHVVSQECRPGGVEGAAAIETRDLLRNSLRMRPDRLIVGEVRGPEAGELVQAMNTGHSGSMGTVHSNTAADAVDRIQAMTSLAWPAISGDVLQRWIAAALDVVVHCERAADGSRRVQSVMSVDFDGEQICMTPIFRAQDDGFTACGEVPSRCLQRMAHHGVEFPPSLFDVAA
jgi:pilus assembly protein CpaF